LRISPSANLNFFDGSYLSEAIARKLVPVTYDKKPASADMYNTIIAKGKHRNVPRIAVARKFLLQALSVIRHRKELTIPKVYLKEKTENGTA
jgi:hypothetical protein